MRSRAVLAAIVGMAVTLTLACNDDSDDDGLPTGPQGALADCDPDIIAPTISAATASPNALWPPNHQMVTVTLDVDATDGCSDPTSRIISVSSNEPINGLGDGDTAPDWVIAGPLTLQLRSERSGLNSGRIYTITVRTTDDHDNEAINTVSVGVAHDQGNE